MAPQSALDTVTLSLSPSQASVLRTILSESKSRTHASTSEWYAYETVYWSLLDKKPSGPELRVFETFAEREPPSGLTNEEMHFSAQCKANKLDIIASKVVRKESEGENEEMSIAFIAHIPIKPECVDQAKDFLTGPYAAAIHNEVCTQYWYAFQRDATTLGLFGVWAGEKELEQHMKGGAVDMLDKGMKPFMSGPFDRRKGSMIAYRT